MNFSIVRKTKVDKPARRSTVNRMRMFLINSRSRLIGREVFWRIRDDISLDDIQTFERIEAIGRGILSLEMGKGDRI